VSSVTLQSKRADSSVVAPYVINNYFYDLAAHDISPNGTHRDALQTQEYDVHAIWGFNVLNATYHALLNIFPTKRPFIIARSTLAGAGTVGGHWGGGMYTKLGLRDTLPTHICIEFSDICFSFLR
jgi:alpha-glucosidase (family GH31 glycosyl hydrolase)